jgi:hypothetical protein
MDKYVEESIKEYGPNKFFLFDKYFWMSLFGIPLKSKEVSDKKVESIIISIKDKELTKIDSSIGFE